MSARFEAFLARIYVDADARRRLLADPDRAALDTGLDASEGRARATIDRVGLELASTSFERKRARHRRLGLWTRLAHHARSRLASLPGAVPSRPSVAQTLCNCPEADGRSSGNR